ncbi:PAAR domain-containing protein [Enterobacteriaceae bacterium H18W14]|uniref:PAAR domain-containing protein n=1 Tax=Dryocola boscaweniae TaxID=2925397 RepID=UPI0022EFD942|nr:PAAR domain-containing protein [Dryocola boscaweniae]MCT4715778.1 PAAR domain-containing protein [Dryocola boscaweniae]
MQNAGRVGDITTHGGAICTGSGDVFINGLPAAMAAASIAPCALGHGAAPIATGSCSVFINGFPAARLGDVTGCGAVVATGSCDVYIGS